MTLSLHGRAALITGASRGLGRTIAEAFARAGADVVLCARTQTQLDETCAVLRSQIVTGQQVLGLPADISQPADVNRLVDFAFAHLPKLDILVSNAGIYGPKGALEDVDWAAWMEGMAINLFGSALLYRAVLPRFKTRGYGKIIQLSGGGATYPLPNLSAYAVSKAAVIRLMETVAEEARAFHVDVNAIAPGALNTGMLDEVLAAGPEKVGAAFYQRSLRQKQEGGAPLQKGADLAVYLASAASDGLTGKLISAVWDPWPTFAEHKQDLDKTDVYTLRRIVPADRGLDWGG
jgi:NAD(P)-dependent dehydrogenase (short-subunit alcohol dehydrogenase family)